MLSYLLSYIGVYSALQYCFWDAPNLGYWKYGYAYLGFEAIYITLLFTSYPRLPFPVSILLNAVYDYQEIYMPLILGVGYAFTLDYILTRNLFVANRVFFFVHATVIFGIPFFYFLNERCRDMIGIAIPEKAEVRDVFTAIFWM